MSKHQVLSSFQFEDLPNEVILKVLKNLDIKDVLRCGLVSKQIRTISRDESIWEKINLYHKEGLKVPIEFLQLVLDSGCKYLSLQNIKLVHRNTGLQLKNASKLRYLNLAFIKSEPKEIEDESDPTDIEEILASCKSLQKLNMDRLCLTPSMIESICAQNSQTLKVLSLRRCVGLDLQFIKQILENCAMLKEIEMSTFYWSLTENELTYLANNLPLGIEKLHLCGNELSDENLIALVTRCQNLKSLILAFEKGITDASLTAIIRNLKHSLEELELRIISGVTSAKVLELKSMEKLKIFNCPYLLSGFNQDEIQALRNTLPINENVCYYPLGDSNPENGIWEIKTKQLKIFYEKEVV